MCRLPQRGAFLRRRIGPQRVDLDDVAGAIGFVRMFGDVEAFVAPGPAVAIPVFHADAVAFQRGGAFETVVAAREIDVEVFLAGQVGASGRAAVAAIGGVTERRYLFVNR